MILTAGEELVKTRLIIPASFACITKLALIPKWLECLTEAIPMPNCSADLMQASMASVAETKPNPAVCSVDDLS